MKRLTSVAVLATLAWSISLTNLWGQVSVNVPGAHVQVGQNPWFSSARVRQQMRIDERQYDKLNQAYNQSWKKYNQSMADLDRKLTAEQRQERLHALNNSFYSDFNKSRAEILKDEAARRRYDQMHWQYLGYGAFSDPAVQEKLQLTKEQQQRFNRYQDESNQQYATWQKNYKTDREGVSKNFNNWWRDSRTNINNTLTPEQRKTWSEMVGEPYEYHAGDYFGE